MKSRSGHRFGGDWTDEKLSILGKYLKSYTTALKRQNFRTGYIDAFAGSGYRTPSSRQQLGEERLNLFDDSELTEPEPQKWLDGSARIALKTAPRFDKYIFVEKSARRCDQLTLLKEEFPLLSPDIDIIRGEANAVIQDICAKNWTHHRAVLFLDPYGMQVEWSTIQSVARTQAIDMFLLFPLGIGVNRLLTRDAEIPPDWRYRLDVLLGTAEWFDEFYRIEKSDNLFDEPVDRVVKASTATIGRFFNDRLKNTFSKVVEEPRVLTNSRGCPLYLLCFAAGNPRGSEIAVGIANHLMRRN